MAVTVWGGALVGIDAIPIAVEVDLLRRLPSVSVVGLAASAVKESAERVRSALASSGLEFPRKRVVVNLAPADVRKEGTAFDLPVALGILAADEQIPQGVLADWVIAGELSLGGALRPIRGALALALLARKLGKKLLLPRACAAEAAAVPGVGIACADGLDEVVSFLRGEGGLPDVPQCPPPRRCHRVDLAEVRGQPVARRALEIAAAGGHHLLMMGPPGCGKSMLARRLPTLLPAPSFEESLQITQVHSVAGLLDPTSGVVQERPFRAPHHSVSVAGLVGSRTLRPGEVSLAHHGVLFLDEATEFSRNALEVLREPLEEGSVRLTRAAGTVVHPAQVILVMASNPCPCGRRGSPHPCVCSDSAVIRYRGRLSGPLLDRVDLHVDLEPVSPSELLHGGPGEDSATVRQRVVAARERQRARAQSTLNARLPASELTLVAGCTPAGDALLHAAMERHALTGRTARGLLRVARTLADLAADDVVDASHVAGALGFRPTLEVV